MKKCIFGLRALVFFAALFAASLCHANSSSCGTKPLFGFDVSPYPITSELIQSLQYDSSARPQMILFYRAWTYDGQPGEFPRSSFDVIWNHGAIPCMSWEPVIISGTDRTNVLTTDLLQGQYEGYLRSFAQQAKNWENPFVIRFGAEMNLSGYHWGVAPDNYNASSPQEYISMFQYVVNIFQEEGADNVFFAFCPNVVSDPVESWNTAANYYPGDAFVDILGMDGYNWNTDTNQPSVYFSDLFSPLLGQLQDINSTLPIFVFETAASIDQTQWLQQASAFAQEWSLDGVFWFQDDKEQNWAIHKIPHRVLKTFNTAPGAGRDWITNLYQQRLQQQ